MRTTVDLPDELFKELKALAAMRGISLREFLETAVKHELAHTHKTPLVRDQAQFPLIKSKHPGTLHLTNDEIDDLLT